MSQPENRTVTKKELVNRISEVTGQTKVVVKDVLQRFLDEIIDELSQGNRLEFREFGVFEVRERAARQAQNPRTLEKVYVPAKRVVKFKVGRTMRERVCDEPAPVPREGSGREEGAAPSATPPVQRPQGTQSQEARPQEARPQGTRPQGTRPQGTPSPVKPPQPPPPPSTPNSPF